MSNDLRLLTVNEISLVDAPANSSTDPVTGRKIPHARVALWKRDGSGDTNDRMKENKKMQFSQVLKSAKTRDEIVAAVGEKARRIAKRDGIGDDAALAKAWQEHPEAQAAYESAPVPTARPAGRKTFAATRAEGELDRRARKRMKKTKCTYAKAVAQELESDPSLYDQYQAETASGSTYDTPEPAGYMEPAAYNSGGGSDRMLHKRILNDGYATDDDDTDDDEDDDDPDVELRDDGVKCSKCRRFASKSDRFCANCGTGLARVRATSARV